MHYYIFSTTERLLAAGGLFIFAVGCLLVGIFNPTTAGFFPACPFLALTGNACPGCGLTRGFHALFHGDIYKALSFNALIPIYVFVFLFFIVSMLSIIFRGRSLKFNILTPVSLTPFLIIAVIFGFIRNIPVYPFTFFFP